MGAQPLTERWLWAVDFDGTVTMQDTLELLCRRYSGPAHAAAEAALSAGQITLEECISREFAPVRGEHDALVAEAVQEACVRPGFAEFVRAAQARGHRVVVISSGFASIIRPVLERAGLGDLELVANDVRFTPQGSSVSFAEGAVCEHCGERCKRPRVAALNGCGPVAYVGDGWSDRCAALAADRRFARDSLASFLDGQGIDYVQFEDFDRIRRELP
jgi:2-hydroxy-3-keto-5-methylthiopentenyl-1-phosphate phosphatase